MKLRIGNIIPTLRERIAARTCRHPKIGIAVIARHDENVLMGLRAGKKVGAGMWQFSGGHLDFMEASIFAAGLRELAEETNLVGVNPRFSNEDDVGRVIAPAPVTSNCYPERNQHYGTIWMVVDVPDPSTLFNREGPDKCERWDWFHHLLLPSPRFEG